MVPFPLDFLKNTLGQNEQKIRIAQTAVYCHNQYLHSPNTVTDSANTEA